MAEIKEPTRTIKDVTLQELMDIFLNEEMGGVHLRSLDLPLTSADKIGAALVGAFLGAETEADSITIEAMLDILDAARWWCTFYARVAHAQQGDEEESKPPAPRLTTSHGPDL